jgi:hypothetical protein
MRNRASAASAAASNEIQSVPRRRDSSRHHSRKVLEGRVAASGLNKPDELGKNDIVEKPVAFDPGCD